MSFDFGFTHTTAVEEDTQFGTALYVAESESKTTLRIPREVDKASVEGTATRTSNIGVDNRDQDILKRSTRF